MEMTGVPPPPNAAQKSCADDPRRAALRRRTLGLTVFILVLACVYVRPLFQWVTFSLQSELYDYAPLIPVVSLYLIWLQRRTPIVDFQPASGWATLTLVTSCGIGVGYWLGVQLGWQPQVTLKEGIRRTADWFKKTVASGK